LHADGSHSRADLAKVTGLTRATVSAVVRELLDDGVVEELGLSTAGGVGKPATLVDIAADGRHVLCVDLSEPAQFVGAIVNLAGKVVIRRTYARQGKTGKAAVTLLRRIVRELAADAERPLLGAGVASPGVVDDDGVVATAAHLGWTDLAVGSTLSAELGIPVAVVNDANAAALAELTFGAAGTARGNLICVRVDKGVGAGLVLDGRLYTGSSYAAGEIGHVVVVPDGARCACGKRGCLETEVSAPLLAARLEAGNGSAVLDRAGEHLGTALATVLSALDVADVVLSGSGSVTTETFRAAAERAIVARTMPLLADRLRVRPSTFGFDDVLVGAAARVLDRELGIR
jgi:predicted NBD/HSP70 family sugar kinase